MYFSHYSWKIGFCRSILPELKLNTYRITNSSLQIRSPIEYLCVWYCHKICDDKTRSVFLLWHIIACFYKMILCMPIQIIIIWRLMFWWLIIRSYSETIYGVTFMVWWVKIRILYHNNYGDTGDIMISILHINHCNGMAPNRRQDIAWANDDTYVITKQQLLKRAVRSS